MEKGKIEKEGNNKYKSHYFLLPAFRYIQSLNILTSLEAEKYVTEILIGEKEK